MYLILLAGYKALWAMQVYDDAAIHLSDSTLCQFLEAEKSPCSIPVSMHGSLLNDWNITIKKSGTHVRVDPSAYVLTYEPEGYRMAGGTLAVAGVVIVTLLLMFFSIWPISRLRNRL